jgi:hypothetical protein
LALSNVRCPNCQSPLSIRVEQLIDVERDPGAKARLLSGSLNRVRCPTCSWEGQLATPLVYHDPGHELLLTYMPVEINLPKAEQERLIGQLINQAITQLPAERRKGYLFQPQAVLTTQGLVERILGADGITREQLEEQRTRVRLLEDFLRTSPEGLAAFASQHDAELDETFFQLATVSLQAARDERTARALSDRLEQVLPLTAYGKRILAREAEVRSAAESLSQLKEPLTREAVLDLILQAGEERQVTLASLARPALDYAFFQTLSERIERADGSEKERLAAIRQRLLQVTQEIDAAQEARIAEAGAVLQALLQAEDLDQALAQALPGVDELFLSLLTANLQAAQQRGDKKTLERLSEIDRRLREIIQENLPPGLQLAQQVLDEPDEAAAQRRIDEAGETLDEDFVNTLLSMAQRLESSGDGENAARMQRLHRYAVGVSMRRKMAGGKG